MLTFSRTMYSIQKEIMVLAAGLWSRYTKAPTSTPTPRFLKLPTPTPRFLKLPTPRFLKLKTPTPSKKLNMY
jgi:hypothetical protein